MPSSIVFRTNRRHFCQYLLAAPSTGIRDSVSLLLRLSDGKLTSNKHGAGTERCAFPPGSTMKPFTVAALLERKLLREDETYLCPGVLNIGGRQLNCVHPRTAIPMNASRALAYSCNCAVAHWASRFGPGNLSESLARFGLKATGLQTTLVALGEEGIVLSPRELLNAYRRLAERGNEAVRTGLEGAVEFGTAQRAALPKLRVAGKTGSVRAPNGGLVAWFAGFAPSRAPEVVIAVLAAGASGGADAAPIAHQILQDYFGGRA